MTLSLTSQQPDGFPSTRKRSETPADPRLASTVILVRQGHEGLEVYLVQRSPKSGFMPGNWVFPGGTVDPGDQDVGFWQQHLDQDLQTLSKGLAQNMPVAQALAHVVCAIRETFEEAGVLLAAEDRACGDGLAPLLQMRTDQGLPTHWLKDTVFSRGWKLGVYALARWSHWITPAARSRRFDARFFVAFPHPGQHCEPDQKETQRGLWVAPKRALEDNLKGVLPLSPPTLVTLHQLLAFKDPKALKDELHARPWGKPVLPRLLVLDQTPVLLMPWDPDYAKDTPPDHQELQKRPAPVGQAFSRMVLHGRSWLPLPQKE